MADLNPPSFVPASLVRLRCFLNRQGMKVKPWLGPEAVLDAFYTTLRAQENNDEFWLQLRQLLRDLAGDMRQRVLGRSWVIDNELLDQSCHASLLDEVRSALGGRPCKGEIRSFALGLPRPAGALLLMLAAAMVVGCGGEVDSKDGELLSQGGTTATSSGTATSGGATTSNATTSGAAMGGASTLAGGAAGGSIWISGAGGTATGISSYVPPCPHPGATSGLDPSQFAACNQKLVSALIPYDLHSDSGKQLLECACLLNDAWQSGLAELFSGQDCGEINDYLGCCGVTRFCQKAEQNRFASEFNADLLVDYSCCLVYLGVRCD